MVFFGLGPDFHYTNFFWSLVPGPRGGATRGPTKKKEKYVFWARGFWKVDPLGSPIRQLPGSLGGLGPTFVQQRLPPELPRATGTPPRSPQEDQPNKKKKIGPQFLESRPSWEPNPSTPWLFGGVRPIIRSTKIASRASQGHWDPQRSPQEDRHFHKKI